MSPKNLALAAGFAIRLVIFMALSLPPLAFIWYPLVWAFYIVSYRRESEQPAPYQKFSKNAPFFHYGVLVAEQNYVFPSLHKDEKADASENHVRHLVKMSLSDLSPITLRLTNPEVRLVTIADVSGWPKPYEKSFVEYSTESYFNTRVSVIFGVSSLNDKVFVRWWILMRGGTEPWKALQAGLIAPFTVLYWGLKKLQGLYSIKAALGSQIEHDYDVLDVESWLGTFQHHFFSNLIHRMEQSGFDVGLYKQQAINFDQPLFIGENTSLQIGTLSANSARLSPIVETQPLEPAEAVEDAQQVPAQEHVASIESRSLFQISEPADIIDETHQTSEHTRIEPFIETPEELPAPPVYNDHDTVEFPAVHFDTDPTMESSELLPSNLYELQQMLLEYVDSKQGEAQDEARIVVNELIVELQTGDEISVKILIALLGELRGALGDTALRDALEMLTDPIGDFNDIVQEITGDMLADLSDELTLKARKQELNEALDEYASKLDLHKRPQARIALYSLIRALDKPDTLNYDSLFKDILLRLGRDAYELVLYTVATQENHFPAVARFKAERQLAMHVKKQHLQATLMSRTRNRDTAKKEKATQAIDSLIAALEDPQITDYKAIFREIGLRVGRIGYEAMLRMLAIDDNYFPIAQSEAKRNLNIYERAQQRQGN